VAKFSASSAAVLKSGEVFRAFCQCCRKPTGCSFAEGADYGVLLPGFVSAKLHISQDKRHVANYAQWRSQQDLDNMMADEAAQTHMRDAASIATSFDPVYYELREALSAE
jgi:hypothetical protein